MRQNVVDDFFSSIIFCCQHEILPCVTKLSMRSCEKKTVVDNQKGLIHFRFSEGKMRQ